MYFKVYERSDGFWIWTCYIRIYNTAEDSAVFFVFNLNNLEHISLLFILILPTVQNSHHNLLTATN
jgi:hypothetical protein